MHECPICFTRLDIRIGDHPYSGDDPEQCYVAECHNCNVLIYTDWDKSQTEQYSKLLTKLHAMKKNMR